MSDFSIASSPLAQDPAYLAFLRASNTAQTTAAQDVGRRSAAIQSALNMRLPQVDANDATSQRNLAGGYESRGVLRSGGYLRDQAEQAARQQYARNALITNTHNEIADLASGLAQNVASQQQRAAEAGLNAANNTYNAAPPSYYSSPTDPSSDPYSARSNYGSAS